MSIPMALVDFIPVVLFLLSAIKLQRYFYNYMSKGAFALFCGGTMMVFVAGFCKALWKLLYCAGICDFEALNKMMFPCQSIGFMLAGCAVIAVLFFPQGEKRLLSVAAAPAVWSGTMLFVVMDVLGVAAITLGLAYVAAKKKKLVTVILFVVSFVLLLGMGYMSTKNFADPRMNWSAEILNSIGQIALLSAVVTLCKTDSGVKAA